MSNSKLGNKEVMAKNLSYYMNEKGLSQRDIAAATGAAPSTVSDWINAKKYPRIDKIEKMANMMNLLKSDLIEEKIDDEMRKSNDIGTDVVARMRKNDDFFELVSILTKLDDEKIVAVRHMLETFYK